MGFKTKLKRYLKLKLLSSDLYLTLRYSEAFLRIWRRLRKEVDIKLNAQAEFYQYLLKNIMDKNSVIFDIGANEGFTTAVFAAVASRTVAVDPSPHNAKILRCRFSSKQHITVLEFAVSDTAGKEQMHVEQGTALHTLNSRWMELLEKGNYRIKTSYIGTIAVTTTTLAALIGEFGCPAFIKIDTEGYEQKVISTLKEPIPQLLFEAILPEFLEETIGCIRHLQTTDPNAVFNYAINDTLMLDDFIDADSLISMLSIAHASTDIICRMSNYHNYYA